MDEIREDKLIYYVRKLYKRFVFENCYWIFYLK